MRQFIVRREGTCEANYYYVVDLPKSMGKVVIRLKRLESGGHTAVVFSYRTFTEVYECEVFTPIPMSAVWVAVMAYLDWELESLTDKITEDYEIFTENSPMAFYFKDLGNNQYMCIRTIAGIRVGTVIAFTDGIDGITDVCGKKIQYLTLPDSWATLEVFVQRLIQGD